MTTNTSAQLQDVTPQDVAAPGRWLGIARLGAMLFMAYCIVTFVWGMLLFPRYGLASLDAIRPSDAWSDATLLAVIADAGLSVAGLGYAQLAVGVLAAALLAAVGLVIFWRKADSWFGLYVGVLFSFGFVVLAAIWAISTLATSQSQPQFTVRDLWVSTIATTLFTVSLAMLPLSIGLAILRYHLWDIDVVIRKTLVYSVLTVLLSLVYFGSVVLLQALSRRLAGVEQSTLAVVISTLAIAALFTPLRRRIQDGIDRLFFRKKYNAQQVLAQFAEVARDEIDP